MIKLESICLIYLKKHSTYMLNRSPIYSAHYWALLKKLGIYFSHLAFTKCIFNVLGLIVGP